MTLTELSLATGIKPWTLRRIAAVKGITWQALGLELKAVAKVETPETPLVAPSKVALRVILPPGTNRIRLECVTCSTKDGVGERTFCTVRDNRNFLPGMELEGYARAATEGGGYEYAGVMPRSLGRW